MHHHFNVDHAKKYGVECAILINYFNYWIEKNKANNKHFYDGKYWTYNSANAFTQLFPYWSAKQIGRFINKLVELKIIQKGNYNKSKMDRTLWFTFVDNNENGDQHLPNLGNGNLDIGNSHNIQLNTININNDFINSEKPKEVNNQFKEFWDKYPKKVGKKSAEKAFNKLKINDKEFNNILIALDKQKETEQWINYNGKFVPNPATWINGERWNDQLDEVADQFAGAI